MTRPQCSQRTCARRTTSLACTVSYREQVLAEIPPVGHDETGAVPGGLVGERAAQLAGGSVQDSPVEPGLFPSASRSVGRGRHGGDAEVLDHHGGLCRGQAGGEFVQPWPRAPEQHPSGRAHLREALGQRHTRRRRVPGQAVELAAQIGARAHPGVRRHADPASRGSSKRILPVANWRPGAASTPAGNQRHALWRLTPFALAHSDSFTATDHLRTQ